MLVQTREFIVDPLSGLVIDKIYDYTPPTREEDDCHNKFFPLYNTEKKYTIFYIILRSYPNADKRLVYSLLNEPEVKSSKLDHHTIAKTIIYVLKKLDGYSVDDKDINKTLAYRLLGKYRIKKKLTIMKQAEEYILNVLNVLGIEPVDETKVILEKIEKHLKYKLSPKAIAALVLVKLYNVSKKDVSRILNVSLPTIYRALKLAEKLLHDK